MTLQLELPADIEHALRARAAAAGMDLAAYVTEVVAERLAEPDPDAPPEMSEPPRRFAERLQTWIDLHSRRADVLDDSRESIYAGCNALTQPPPTSPCHQQPRRRVSMLHDP